MGVPAGDLLYLDLQQYKMYNKIKLQSYSEDSCL